MPYYGFGDALRLLDGRVELFHKEVQHQLATVELKGHERGGDVLVCGADVVQ